MHGATRYVDGHFVQMARGDRHGRYQAFSAVLRPWLWFATRSRNSRVFQNQSVKDIVTDVLTPYSTDFEWRLLVASAYQPLEYCTQVRRERLRLRQPPARGRRHLLLLRA